MYVSEETLLRTANTIKNCPLVWKYDERLDDIYTHDKDEVPCGFVPETAEIQQRKLADGRTMLSVIAYVWKRYTGELLGFFKRDGGTKPVSVEMSVYDTALMADGLIELRDFKYEGITVLGSFVTPAIPNANATVLSFSSIRKEYKEAVEKEFMFADIDMVIPEDVKETARKGLELRKSGNPATSVGVATAKYLINNSKITPERVTQAVKYFSLQKKTKIADNQSETDKTDWLLWGGDSGLKWIRSLSEKMVGEQDAKLALYEAGLLSSSAEESFSDGNIGDIIPNFDSSTKEESKKEDISMDEIKKEEMAVVEDAPVAEVAMAEVPDFIKAKQEKAEEKPEEKKEEKKFEFPKNFNLETMSKMFAEEEEDEDVKMAKAEVEKGEFADPSVLMAGMFAKMCKMADAVMKMSEDAKVYMAENEDLKKFKADMEMAQKLFAIESTLKELSEKVIIPDEAREEMISEAEKYTFSDIESWKTFCKAKSFEFAIKDSGKSDVVRVGMPFAGTNLKKKDDLWS